MGLPLPANVPQITVGGRTYGVGAFLWNTASGSDYMFGVFELKSSGWDFVTSPNYCADYANPGDLIADVKAKGGIKAFISWIVGEINKAFAKLFGVTAPPTTEPTNDDEALAHVQAAFATMKLTLVNGVPVLA